jgi:hypothetical protein
MYALLSSKHLKAEPKEKMPPGQEISETVSKSKTQRITVNRTQYILKSIYHHMSSVFVSFVESQMSLSIWRIPGTPDSVKNSTHSASNTTNQNHGNDWIPAVIATR